MFDAPTFCYMWIKSLEIGICLLIIHQSKYSYEKLFPRLQLWFTVS